MGQCPVHTSCRVRKSVLTPSDPSRWTMAKGADARDTGARHAQEAAATPRGMASCRTASRSSHGTFLDSVLRPRPFAGVHQANQSQEFGPQAADAGPGDRWKTHQVDAWQGDPRGSARRASEYADRRSRLRSKQAPGLACQSIQESGCSAPGKEGQRIPVATI